jgi:hypothetical protein
VNGPRNTPPAGPAIPAEIASALRAAFGDRPVDGLTPLAGGLSRAPLFAFAFDGASYVVRKGDPHRAPNEIPCMRIAAERGVAPPLRYADARTGVSIVARVNVPPPVPSARPDPTRVPRIAAALRRLHDGPAFPRGAGASEILRDIDRSHAALAGAALPAAILRTVRDLEVCTARPTRPPATGTFTRTTSS